MSVSIWQDSEVWPAHLNHSREEADVCIVGAGIVGAVCAKLLSDLGKHVVVLEAARIASGASGRNAGHCIAAFRRDYHNAISRFGRDRAKNIRALFVKNRTMLRTWLDELSVPYEASGSQYLGIDKAECAEMQKSAQLLNADGFDVAFTEGDPLGAGFSGRLYQPGDIGLNPYLLVRGLLQSSGASVRENAEVHTIEQGHDNVVVVATGVSVKCNRVVLATNAYSRRLHPFFRDKVYPVRAQMYATEPTSKRIITMPTGTQDGFEYFRQLPDGRFLIGGYRDRFVEEERGFGDETTPHLQSGLETWVKERFPEIAQLKITHRWSGTMGFTNDGLPLIGKLPDMPDVYFAVGFTGHGMSAGPVAAEILVDYMINGREPPDHFRPARFA